MYTTAVCIQYITPTCLLPNLPHAACATTRCCPCTHLQVPPTPTPPPPTPTPPPPPPAENYCCGTSDGECRVPVPRPPQALPRKAQRWSPKPWPLPAGTKYHVHAMHAKKLPGAHAAGTCSAAGLRQPVGNPPFTGINRAAVLINFGFTDRLVTACPKGTDFQT